MISECLKGNDYKVEQNTRTVITFFIYVLFWVTSSMQYYVSDIVRDTVMGEW